MKPLSSPQPASPPPRPLFPALYPLIICSPCAPIILFSCGTYRTYPSFPPSFVPPFLHAAVLDSALVDVFPVRQLFLVFASSIPAKPMTPPLPQQRRWWIDPVRVIMGYCARSSRVPRCAHLCFSTCAPGDTLTCVCVVLCWCYACLGRLVFSSWHRVTIRSFYTIHTQIRLFLSWSTYHKMIISDFLISHINTYMFIFICIYIERAICLTVEGRRG